MIIIFSLFFFFNPLSINFFFLGNFDFLILFELYYLYNSSPRFSSQKMLVPVLWRSPVWKTTRSFQKFLRSLTESSAYGTLVEKLTFKTYSNSPIQIFTTQTLSIIASQCPNVQYLTFDCLRPSTSSYFMTTNSDLPPDSLVLLLKR